MKNDRKAGPALTAAALLLLAVCPAAGAGSLAGGATPSTAPRAAAAPPFARVYLALRGCTSCSHCRSTIRQMVQGSAKGGEARVDGGQIEVRYARPRPVPLREVIRTLAENRLHDLSLVDVLFEARGTLQTGPDGSARFTLEETRQTFRITVDRKVEQPLEGRPVRLTAVVEGWRGTGDLTLVARTIKPEA